MLIKVAHQLYIISRRFIFSIVLIILLQFNVQAARYGDNTVNTTYSEVMIALLQDTPEGQFIVDYFSKAISAEKNNPHFLKYAEIKKWDQMDCDFFIYALYRSNLPGARDAEHWLLEVAADILELRKGRFNLGQDDKLTSIDKAYIRGDAKRYLSAKVENGKFEFIRNKGSDVANYLKISKTLNEKIKSNPRLKEAIDRFEEAILKLDKSKYLSPDLVNAVVKEAEVILELNGTQFVPIQTDGYQSLKILPKKGSSLNLFASTNTLKQRGLELVFSPHQLQKAGAKALFRGNINTIFLPYDSILEGKLSDSGLHETIHAIQDTIEFNQKPSLLHGDITRRFDRGSKLGNDYFKFMALDELPAHAIELQYYGSLLRQELHLNTERAQVLLHKIRVQTRMLGIITSNTEYALSRAKEHLTRRDFADWVTVKSIEKNDKCIGLNTIIQVGEAGAQYPFGH